MEGGCFTPLYTGWPKKGSHYQMIKKSYCRIKTYELDKIYSST